MAKKIFSFRMDPDLIARVDGVGGDRTAFVTAAVQRALDDGVKISGQPVGVHVADDILRDHVVKTEVVGKSGKPDEGKSISKRRVAQKKNSTAGACSRVSDRRDADDALLLDFLKCGVRTERQIAKEIRWPEMRVSKAVARLGAAGKVKFTGGAIEVIG